MTKDQAISQARSIISSKMFNWPRDEWISVDPNYDLNLSLDFRDEKVATLYGYDEDGNRVCESISVY